MNDLKEQCLKNIKIPSLASRTHLSQQPIGYILTTYLSWIKRLVHAHPRVVYRSNKLVNHPAYETYRTEVSYICAGLAIGRDITPHLSGGIHCGYSMKVKPRKVGRHFDGMLFDWGIHHLHLSRDVASNGIYFERTSTVIAVIFTFEAAYLIDLITHGDWTDKGLLQTAVDEWPQKGLFLEIPLMPSGNSYTDQEIKGLRDIGITTTVEVNNKVYIAKDCGISSAGTPIKASSDAQQLIKVIKAIENDPSSVIDQLQAQKDYDLGEWPRIPSLKIMAATSPAGFSFDIVEAKSKRRLSLHTVF